MTCLKTLGSMKIKDSKNPYGCKTPCGNCPYRKDAPLQLWKKEEFENLAHSEEQLFGRVYNCHKNNGTRCVGWLMMQDKNGFPNLTLRIDLTKFKVDREHLDSLHCRSEMYASIPEMIKANYKI